jgi:hypothetical protein
MRSQDLLLNHWRVFLFSKHFDDKHEAKLCPRCRCQFICKANRIHRCDCTNVCLSPETRERIRQLYDECLCPACLQELETIKTIAPGTFCYLDVPAGKTFTAFTKPVSAMVRQYISEWEAIRPEQPSLLDLKNG